MALGTKCGVVLLSISLAGCMVGYAYPPDYDYLPATPVYYCQPLPVTPHYRDHHCHGAGAVQHHGKHHHRDDRRGRDFRR